MSKKFYLGLDIGTGSVGFAATDEKYNVIAKSGKPLMGVRLFEEANTASERRIKRANKVRLNRIKNRLLLLQELFDEEIKKVDPLFFLRIKSSSLWQEDKEERGLGSLNSLFADENYSDKNHFKNFATIYHLRYFLMNPKNWERNTPDIRLVYLACHHILKARGHLLLDVDDFNVKDVALSGKSLFEELNNYLENEVTEDDSNTIFDLSQYPEVEIIAKDAKMRIRQKRENLQKILYSGKDKKLENIIKAFLGETIKTNEIFPIEDITDETKTITLNSEWETLEANFSAILGDSFELLVIIKKIYDWFSLMNLLKGKDSVSEAMLIKYNKHKKDLKDLKKLVKEKAKHKYYKIFRSESEENNYAAYIGSNLNKGKTIISKCKKEDFYSFIKKELADILSIEVIDDLVNGTFLPKIRTKENATIPFQLHKKELRDILLNTTEKFNIDTSKVLQLISFKVDYFVGRLNTHNQTNRHVWMEKKEEYKYNQTKITPWNYSEVIDLEKSEEKFIQRMLSQCSYLRKEAVLPKHSLIYSKFVVLNELNNLKINSEPITVELKQKIYNDLFKQIKKVSITTLLKFLGNDIAKSDISGFDIEKGGFTASLSSYLQAGHIFNNEADTEENEALFEKVILWQALFSDKKRLEGKIRQNYSHLSEEMIKKLKGLNFSGFGNLSEKFLTAQKIVRHDTGELTSIIDLLWNTNQNLMQIIHNQLYNVEEWIKSENNFNKESVTYEDIHESYASPSVKRATWQAMLVVDEIVELVGQKPDKIFIEVTRSGKNKNEKKRSVSRKDQLLESVSLKEFKEVIKSKNEREFRSDKIYLYFLQNGKCAYSGEAINLSEINNDNLYDIDHIFPQALKKDDSLNNRVLVKKELNGLKGKNYPLNKTQKIWSKKDILIPMWESWHKSNLMSNEKLQRLKRTTELSEAEQEEFIARQLVFTGQSATLVARLFQEKFKESEVIYSKAGNVSDFRHKFDLLKCREVNDFHHAHDAYLNIVVGNTYNQRFSRNKNFYAKEFKDEKWKIYSQNKIFEYDVSNAWKNNETILTVKKFMSRNNLLVTKKTYEKKGEFYNQNLCSASAHQKEIKDGRKSKESLLKESILIPQKGLLSNPLNNVSKYGGYKSLSAAYFIIVEHTDKKGKRQREFWAISLLQKKSWEKLSQDEQLKELSENFVEPKIIVSKVLLGTLFNINKMSCRIVGWNRSKMLFRNANQLFLDKDFLDYIRLIFKYNDMVKEGKSNFFIKDDDSIEIAGGKKTTNKLQILTKEKNIQLWDIILAKLLKLYRNMQDLKGKNFGLPDLYDDLIDCQDVFFKSSIDEQIKALSGIIKGLSCHTKSFDLSGLGKSKYSRIIQPSPKINYPLIMINQSITGAKEKHIKIYPFEDEE
ncbi:MAG: type II CRISPR RNA-guided endonuclease Cas9 [Erysipelotrichales bacterium]|nr:type II CRISPR RNA-guided endonuclease Cas9 [Erysipelotrichales bacterium]